MSSTVDCSVAFHVFSLAAGGQVSALGHYNTNEHGGKAQHGKPCVQRGQADLSLLDDSGPGGDNKGTQIDGCQS